ncbi:transmembrane protein 119-like [Scleropages formosus]|uniref:Transmembrane protein 119-like n=1 Tax=Scleropages formosus TaxID=113540 RepID=A0A0P7WBF7_SCLFO|nr:transmembrane protein 119-like [Scleropages formosus]
MKETLLGRAAGFLRENLLLSIAAPSLLVAVIVLLCCASAVGHKRKSNAYYPSSFPAQKYVDERDKAGGAGTFSEVPERPADSRCARPVDSAKQLRADIRNAAKNLRTPAGSPAGETGGKETRPQPAEVKGWTERPAAAASEGAEGGDVSPGQEAEMSRAPEEHRCPTQPQDALLDPAEDATLEGDGFGQEAERDEASTQEAREEATTSPPGPAQKDEAPLVELITAETAAF